MADFGWYPPGCSGPPEERTFKQRGVKWLISDGIHLDAVDHQREPEPHPKALDVLELLEPYILDGGPTDGIPQYIVDKVAQIVEDLAARECEQCLERYAEDK